MRSQRKLRRGIAPTHANHERPSRAPADGVPSHHPLARASAPTMSSSPTAGDAPPAEEEPYMSPGAIGACLTIIPNATLWYGLSRGRNKLETLVKTTVRYLGVPGLLAIPFCGMAMEKCFYDTLVSAQGVDPNVQNPDRARETFPAGGHALPSFSLVPVKHIREYFR